MAERVVDVVCTDGTLREMRRDITIANGQATYGPITETDTGIPCACSSESSRSSESSESSGNQTYAGGASCATATTVPSGSQLWSATAGVPSWFRFTASSNSVHYINVGSFPAIDETRPINYYDDCLNPAFTFVDMNPGGCIDGAMFGGFFTQLNMTIGQSIWFENYAGPGEIDVGLGTCP